MSVCTFIAAQLRWGQPDGLFIAAWRHM